MQVMKCAILSCVLAAVGASSVTPVQQVLNMLNEMKSKGLKEKEEEKKIFAEYTEWADDKQRELGFEIKAVEASIDKLTAFIEEAEQKIAELTKLIEEDDANIATLEDEKAAATKVREMEHAEFLKVEQDTSESVDALERAIQVLSAQAYSRPQAESLLQRMAKGKPALQTALAAFLQETTSEDAAPEVMAYKFQSSSIIDLLEKLLQKFKLQLDELQTDESNQAHAFAMQDEHLKNEINQLMAERQRKAEAKAETQAASAKAQGELVQAKSDLKDDKEFLAHVTSTYEEKARQYDVNQELREQELKALSQAIEIISNPDVSSNYAEHINAAMAQVSPHKPANFLQIGRSTRVTARQQATEFLQKRAAALNSNTLAELAKVMGATSENPFAKVITMIEDLLARLKDQAAAEAEHKAWCDEQLKENKLKRDAKTIAVEKLTAQIDKLTGEIADMGEQIDVLVAEQAELTKAMAEATKIRAKEKATNLDTIADAQAGAAAVASALQVLQEFYAAEGDASFLQKGKQVPEMAAYKPMASGGVIGMLEVIQTDFMRLEADTKAAEAQAQKEYDAFMAESEATKKKKHEEEVQLRLDKDTAEFDKSELEKDRDAEQAELDAANKYYAELKPQCTQVAVSWDERVQKREEELAALNEAYDILNSKSVVHAAGGSNME